MPYFGRERVIHVTQLDRPLAEAEAIGRAIRNGARWARVLATERIQDSTGTRVWEIKLKVRRRRRYVGPRLLQEFSKAFSIQFEHARCLHSYLTRRRGGA